ncbi:mCG1027768 [Mus musculus]|nr:mCG1027768 [Mus musculus]
MTSDKRWFPWSHCSGRTASTKPATPPPFLYCTKEEKKTAAVCRSFFHLRGIFC